ncbi:MAG: vWA domain-containing protein [Bacteroidota bacterium]
MKTIKVLFTVAIIAIASTSFAAAVRNEEAPAKQTIMLALLLDTSNSMDGLIDQAKSQLWKIVNELANARCDDSSRPSIKIALYEYGNSGLPATLGYIRQVSALTSDLDLISEKLFALRTNGGDEYCGQVIKTSLNELEWSASGADLKMIFIAGNEPFTQGEVSYRTACSLAKEKDVVINTIFCGPYSEGVATDWKNGAIVGGGSYMSIEQDRKTVYVHTPYDDKIDALNNKLNDTYVYYGVSGASKKANQADQDSNAASLAQENKVERTVAKSKAAYSNSNWDLVDASKGDGKVIEEAKESELPKEMKGMNIQQRKDYVALKSKDRASIQKEIQDLSVQRQQYIDANTSQAEKDAMLDGALMKSIKQTAKSKNLNWQK